MHISSRYLRLSLTIYKCFYNFSVYWLQIGISTNITFCIPNFMILRVSWNYLVLISESFNFWKNDPLRIHYYSLWVWLQINFAWFKQIYNVGMLKMSHWSLLEGKVLCNDNYVIQMCRKLLDFLLLFSLNAFINVVVPSVFEHWGSALAELVVQPFVQLMPQGYMGGAPADVKTGAVFPCCIIGTATALKWEGKNIKGLVMGCTGI